MTVCGRWWSWWIINQWSLIPTGMVSSPLLLPNLLHFHNFQKEKKSISGFLFRKQCLIVVWYFCNNLQHVILKILYFGKLSFTVSIVEIMSSNCNIFVWQCWLAHVKRHLVFLIFALGKYLSTFEDYRVISHKYENTDTNVMKVSTIV